MTAATLVGSPLRRVSFTFSLDARHAACLAASEDGGWQVESWSLNPDASGALPAPVRPAAARREHLHTQLLALAGGAVMLCRHGAGRHELALIEGPDAAHERHLAWVRSPGLRLLAYPGDDGAVLALGADTTPVTTVSRVPVDGSAPEVVAELPGLFGGGLWLDTVGQRLVLDEVRDGRVKSVVLDLRTAKTEPFLEMAEHSNDRLRLCDPVGGLLVVSSDAPGQDRLGWIRLPANRDEPSGHVRFPEIVRLPNTAVRPVAIAPDGNRVALQLDRGATSRLAVWGPEEGTLLDVMMPEGCLGGVARWTHTGLHIPFSAPDRPSSLATVLPDRPGRWNLAGSGVPRPHIRESESRHGASAPGWPTAHTTDPDTESGAPPGAPAATDPTHGSAIAHSDETSWKPPQLALGDLRGEAGDVLSPSVEAPGESPWRSAHLELLVGDVGPVECIVYGGLDWRTAEHVVVALHGGPAAAWRFEFSPVLQHLAAHGIAVVAPNQRGSIGYGDAYASCLHGAWGGPDLDDISAIARAIGPERAAAGLPLPALFGTSYGAYLALLAAGTSPAAWSCVLAIAPFLSGPRLIAEASVPVRALMARLGGDVELDDALGPRDVVRLCEGIRAPLLFVHGDRDDVIPVGQSRSLRHRLLRIGRHEGTDFRYLELPGQGHEVFAGDGAPELYTLLTAFLRTGKV